METDVQLKVLARQFPQDMLRLIGDREGGLSPPMCWNCRPCVERWTS
jgi:hypothetical protein